MIDELFYQAIGLGEALGEEKLYLPISELAWLYQEKGETQYANELHEKVLETADREASFYSCIHLGELYQHLDFSKSIQYLRQFQLLKSTLL